MNKVYTACIVEQSFPCTSSESWVNFNLGFWDISLLWDQREIFSEFLWGCLGYQKFCFHACILGGSSISCVDGKSEILTPLLCCLRDQKFWILPLLFGGSEILTPLLCCLGGQKFWIPLLCCLGDQKFWLFSCQNSDSSLVLFGGQKF